jgi:hypothetical protein
MCSFLRQIRIEIFNAIQQAISLSGATGVATRLRAGLYEVRIPVRARDFSLPKNLHAGPEPHTAV